MVVQVAVLRGAPCSAICVCVFFPSLPKKKGKKAVWELCSAAWAGKPQPRVPAFLQLPVLLGTARGEQQLLLGCCSPLVGKKTKQNNKKQKGGRLKVIPFYSLASCSV